MSKWTQFKSITSFAAVAMAVTMYGCSSSQVDKDASADAAPPVADAATDALPPAPDQAPTAPADPSVSAAPTMNPAADPITAPPSAPVTAPAEDAAKNLAPPVTTPMANAPSADSMSYTVQEGDTLMKIAYENYGDIYKWKEIYEANKDQLSSPTSLTKGTVLKLEKPQDAVEVSHNGKKYLIKNGDTLGMISGDVYGTQKKWKRLWENNKQLIKNPNRIFVGFFLYYTMTPEDRKEFEQYKHQVVPPSLGESQKPAESGGEPQASNAPTTSDRAPASTPPQAAPAQVPSTSGNPFIPNMMAH